MPEFTLRVWAEQTLFDCRDYRVTADALEAAVTLLKEQQERADETAPHPITHGDIRALHAWQLDEVIALDPQEVVDGCEGVTLIDEEGNRVRDLENVPTGCVQLGEPLAID